MKKDHPHWFCVVAFGMIYSQKHTIPQINGIPYIKKKFFTQARRISEQKQTTMHSK